MFWLKGAMLPCFTRTAGLLPVPARAEFALHLLRVCLPQLAAAEREALVRLLVDQAFKVDTVASVDAFDKNLAQLPDITPFRDRLLRRSFVDVDPANIPQALLDRFAVASGASLYYSQEGEDILLARMFGERSDGFFVDVGAHHATRFSNTFLLYRRGWQGINIDATPGSMESFRRLRPRDVNLEAAVSDSRDAMVLHLFKEAALNTFDSRLAATYEAGGWEKCGMVELMPRSLSSILEEHLPAGRTIDLLSVDVEGEDLAALRSNDWLQYRPQIVILEALETSLDGLRDDPAVQFVVDQEYVPFSRLCNSVVLRRADG